MLIVSSYAISLLVLRKVVFVGFLSQNLNMSAFLKDSQRITQHYLKLYFVLPEFNLFKCICKKICFIHVKASIFAYFSKH